MRPPPDRRHGLIQYLLADRHRSSRKASIDRPTGLPSSRSQGLYQFIMQRHGHRPPQGRAGQRRSARAAMRMQIVKTPSATKRWSTFPVKIHLNPTQTPPILFLFFYFSLGWPIRRFTGRDILAHARHPPPTPPMRRLHRKAERDGIWRWRNKHKKKKRGKAEEKKETEHSRREKKNTIKRSHSKKKTDKTKKANGNKKREKMKITQTDPRTPRIHPTTQNGKKQNQEKRRRKKKKKREITKKKKEN